MARNTKNRGSLLQLKLLVVVIFLPAILEAQDDRAPEILRGSVTAEREWWDLRHYRLEVAFDPKTKKIAGSNAIRFKTLKPGKRMQIDLQEPLSIDSVVHEGESLLSLIHISEPTRPY